MKKLFLLIGIFQLAMGMAQDNSELETVSVTANRLVQKANETGRSVTVIDGKMFEELPVLSLDELLRYVPGVEVQSRGPMGAQSDIVIRGGTFQQVLVLLDGVEVNDPLTGHFNGYIPVAPYEIDHIEVLRGAAAGAYGAGAVGGVINVITKTFSKKTDTKSTSGRVKLTGGQYNLFGADAGMEFRSKNVFGNFGLLSNNTSGQLLRGDNRGFVHNNTWSGSVGFQLKNDWTLALRVSYDHRNFAAQNFYTTFLSDTATEKVGTFWTQAQLRKTTAKGSQEWDAVYKRTSDNYLYNPSSVANQNNTDFSTIQYINNHQYSNNWSSSLGGQISLRSLKSNDRGDHNETEAAVFGTALYRLDRWRFSGSLRGDYDEIYNFKVLPMATISYLLPKITFRANAGRAIRSADFTERFSNYNKENVSGGTIGNPDLNAERSWNYEVGATAGIDRYLSVDATLFLRNQNDVIDWVNTPYAAMPRKQNLVPGGTYSLAENIRSVNTKGAELNLVFQKRFSAEQQVYANAGISFLDSRSDTPVPSFYIIAHAKILAQGNIIYQYKNLSVSTSFLYKKRQPLAAQAINSVVSASYFIANAKMAYSIRHAWSVFINCANIGDVSYYDLLGSKMPGRWMSGGIAFNW